MPTNEATMPIASNPTAATPTARIDERNHEPTATPAAVTAINTAATTSVVRSAELNVISLTIRVEKNHNVGSVITRTRPPAASERATIFPTMYCQRATPQHKMQSPTMVSSDETAAAPSA